MQLRIVVFSDSHNNFPILRSIVLSQPTAEFFLHLGDGENEFKSLCAQFPDKLLRCVRGNCDWASDAKTSDCITCERKKILFTHGHFYGVKSDLDKLTREARGIGADIVLYGHTHIAHTGYEDGLYIMNPGSVTLPKRGGPSYGVLDITRAGIVTNIVAL